jgi:hypothetical protein
MSLRFRAYILICRIAQGEWVRAPITEGRDLVGVKEAKK